MKPEAKKHFEDLKRKYEEYDPWQKVGFAIWELIKSFFTVLWFTGKIIYYFIKGVVQIFAQIAFFLFILLFIIGFGIQILGTFRNESVIDITKFNVLIILSATLSLLTMEFKNMVKGEPKLTKEKEDALRQSAEMLFGSTIYFVLVYLISLLYVFTKDIALDLFNIAINISKVSMDKLITAGILIVGIFACWNFFMAIYMLLTKVGTIYQFPEETDEKSFWQRIWDEAKNEPRKK